MALASSVAGSARVRCSPALLRKTTSRTIPSFETASNRRCPRYRCGAVPQPNSAVADKQPRVPVFRLISACVEMNALVQNYEVFAGRTAMIGFVIATLAELSTDQGLFESVTVDDFSLFGGLTLASITLAAGLAALPNPVFGSDMQEAVIASLTAAKRSAGSVTQFKVDKAVDYLFDKVFDVTMIYRLLDDDLA